MIKFLNPQYHKLILIYSITYTSLILAPNNMGIMPSNYSIAPLSYFFILFFFLFIFLILIEKYFGSWIISITYTLLLVLIFDFIKIKYNLFSYSSFLLSLGITPNFISLLKNQFILLFILLSILFVIANLKFNIIGKISKFIVIIFFPFTFVFFSHYFLHYYDNFKFENKLKLEQVNLKLEKKNKVILLFDELDYKILKLELNNLPSFKILQNNSIKYSNVIAPGLETFDVIPNLINLKSRNVGIDANLKLKKKENYLNLINDINKNEKNLFSILNKNNNELLILSYYHKLCKHFNKYFGECFEHKYYKKPDYRNLIKNKEVLKSHVHNYELNFKIFDYFLNNNELKSAFLHIQVPHAPYFYDPIQKKFKFINTDNQFEHDKGYFGGLVLADNYLNYVLEKQKKYKFDIIIISDHGLRSEYKKIIGVDKLKYQDLYGRSVLTIKKYNSNLSNTVIKRVKLEEEIQNYL